MRSSRIIWAVAVLCPIVAAAADRSIKYDLNGRSDSLGEVKVSEQITLNVTGLNPVRYRYGTKTSTTVLSDPNLAEIFSFLPMGVSGSAISQGASPEADSAPAFSVLSTADKTTAAATVTELQGQLNTLNDQLLEKANKAGRTAADNTQLAELVRQRASLEVQVRQAQDRLNAIEARLEEAKRLLDAANARLAAAEQVNIEFNEITELINGLTRRVDAHAHNAGERTAAIERIDQHLLILYKTTDDISDSVLTTQITKWTNEVVAEAAHTWPATPADSSLESVNGLDGRLKKLQYSDSQAFSLWLAQGGNAASYTAAGKRLEEIAEALKAISKNKETYTQAVARLGLESARLGGLPAEGLSSKEYIITCANQPNKTAWTLTIQDRLPKTSGGGDPKNVEIATFVCSSRITMSSGLLLSGLPERKFAFKPSRRMDGAEAISENIVTLENDSDFQPQLGLLANVRLGTLTSGHWPLRLHWSFGVAVDLGGEDNSVLGLVPSGLTVSLADFAYFTGGASLGRIQSPTLGYGLGTSQPENVSDVPLTNRWDWGWGLGVTFKIK